MQINNIIREPKFNLAHKSHETSFIAVYVHVDVCPHNTLIPYHYADFLTHVSGICILRTFT